MFDFAGEQRYLVAAAATQDRLRPDDQQDQHDHATAQAERPPRRASRSRPRRRRSGAWGVRRNPAHRARRHSRSRRSRLRRSPCSLEVGVRFAADGAVHPGRRVAGSRRTRPRRGPGTPSCLPARWARPRTAPPGGPRQAARGRPAAVDLGPAGRRPQGQAVQLRRDARDDLRRRRIWSCTDW